MLLGMLGLALVWLSQLPFGIAGHWWDRRYDLTDEGYLVVGVLELGRARRRVPLHLPRAADRDGDRREAAERVVAARRARLRRDRGGVPARAPLHRHGGHRAAPRPRARCCVRADERAQGLPDIPIRVEHVSDSTDQANAFAVGLGPSRRVVIWDTLLDGEYSNAEVNAVLAHELGHHSSNHLPKGLAWYALFALPGTFLIARVTRRRGGMARAEAVPLGLLVVAALQLVAVPAQNWISRRMESEADWKSLQTTHDPQAMRSLFVRFSTDDLGDPSPPTWAYVLFEGHPTLAQRSRWPRPGRRNEIVARSFI